MAGTGNSAGTSNNAGNVADIKPPVVCRRWRELSRLLLGNYGRVLQGGNVMSYDINNNCAVCDQYRYDQHKKSCEYYVKETYLEFIKRIKEVAK
jgi:hypothetical protein